MVWQPLMATDDVFNAAISAHRIYPDLPIMFSIDQVFKRLSASPFRQRFHLGVKEYRYCQDKGPETVSRHAADFMAKRLAPAEPEHDGKQTPMRGHPVFIAQHATATCCRGCLEKWHSIPAHTDMTVAQQEYVVTVIMHWLHQEMQRPAPVAKAQKAGKKTSANPDKAQQLNLL
ncbi:DUF4186 domain-containing protein [Rahnella perminowiae]|jgi:predicted Fe-S protein YdhL (DUF1289 family)|uniref:DUF4186 domain-containing protein n=2 Tax=Rahnella perminowiae TaxID=2816244 RepID=A0ABS6L0U6_9GAMM|nr:DUF4186 domain-containing protein [Rahnella perminowiae]MBU9825029.1 DUF4186 domain-containing protein [Rahnella perminowiae]MBU9835330.1 DUF4186 domain-containing protein [Rahnella perminowiae]